MAKILLTGGGGYVGSTTCAFLLDQGHQVFVIDDFSTGRKELILTKNFVEGRVGDRKLVSQLLQKESFDCVMHFAAFTEIAESFKRPEEYFANNVRQTERLLDTLIEFGVKKFIFSSSCAVFGEAAVDWIDELQPKRPISPYGASKLASEKHLEKLSATQGLECIVLRFFNAAGADPKCRTGEWHKRETRLIPLALKAAREQAILSIFGDDYPTPDKSCIRDYIHVSDLARGHAIAMNRLLNYKVGFEDYNLGSSSGFSVREVIAEVERITGQKIQTKLHPRRIGDPARLISSIKKAQKILGFEPKLSDLDSIIQSAWDWDQKCGKI